MRSSQHLRRRILSHLLVGGAVLSAGCIVDDRTTDDEANDAASDGEVARPDAAPIDAEVSLPPLPEFAHCDQGGCLPSSPEGECPSVDDARPDLNYTPDDTFECCFFGEIGGPYAAPPEQSSDHVCCYIMVGEQECPIPGRPFFVAQDNRQAPVTHRADWC